MGDPVSTTFAILGGAVKGISAAQTIAGARVQRENLRTRRTQERVAATQRSIQRTQELARVLSANAAMAGARGVDLSSPSFRSVQANDFNVFNQDQAADALNMRFRENFLNQQIRSVSRGARASLINLASESLQQAALLKFGGERAKSGLFSSDKETK